MCLHSSTPDSVVISENNFFLFRKNTPSDREGGGLYVMFNNIAVKAVLVQVFM